MTKDELEILIVDDENEDCNMSPEEFLQDVCNELNVYIPKLKRFAKNHSKEECLAKTGTWWDEARIYSTTEKTLDEYITTVLFAG